MTVYCLRCGISRLEVVGDWKSAYCAACNGAIIDAEIRRRNAELKRSKKAPLNKEYEDHD